MLLIILTVIVVIVLIVLYLYQLLKKDIYVNELHISLFGLKFHIKTKAKDDIPRKRKSSLKK